MRLKNLEQLMVEELFDLYDAEKQITGALPRMAKKARSADLREAFADHIQQTEDHVQRLEEVFTHMNISSRRKQSRGMQALIKEGTDLINQASSPDARDAAIISATQRMKHYEMARYGTVVSYAHQLDHDEIADKLQKTLNEEKETDLILSQIAENRVNQQAK